MHRKVLLQVVTAMVLVVSLAITQVASADGPWTIITLGTGSGSPLGDVSGVEREVAQTFKAPGTGAVSAFKIQLGANTGSPSGNITWKICADYLGTCGFVLGTGTFTGTASAFNTITITGGPVLTANANYWLVFLAADQSTNNSWTFVISTASTYADGSFYISVDREATWSVQTGDMNVFMTIAAVAATNTPAATSTPADTATPTLTLTPTATVTPDTFIVATFALLPDYPIAVKPVADMGVVSLTGVVIVLTGIVGLFFVGWIFRRR